MKKTALTTTLLIISSALCFSQNHPKAPEAGTYKGFSSSSSLTSTPRTYGAGVDNTDYGVNSQLMPSIFGDLIIYQNGTYKLTNAGEMGRWTYHPATETVIFTGKLSTSKVKYNYRPEYINFQISFPYQGKSIDISFSKKRELAFVKPTKPNDNFSGDIVAETRNGDFHLIDVQSGRSTKSVKGYHPSKNVNGEIAALSSFGGNSDVYVYDKTGELKYTISGEKIASSDAISSYYAASLSPDGNYLVLTGTASGFSIAGDPVYVIIDKEGKTLAKINVGVSTLWPASWTADNQCLVSGTDKVVLFNPRNNSASTLYNRRVSRADLSNDRQKMLLVKNNRISVLDVSTGKERPFADGKYDQSLSGYTINSVVWSADEKSVAVSVQHTMIVGYKIILLAVDGSNAIFLADDNGQDWAFGTDYIGY